MASANRTRFLEILAKSAAGAGALAPSDLVEMLSLIPFFDDTAPAFTGAPTIGGFGIVTGTPDAVARTATADGTTTGTIAAAGMVQIVKVTATDANHIIVLPAPVLGKIVVLIEVTTAGYELRTSAPATIGINGGTGASAESAIPASTTAILICETATNWKGLQLSSTAGTLAKVEVAA